MYETGTESKDFDKQTKKITLSMDFDISRLIDICFKELRSE